MRKYSKNNLYICSVRKGNKQNSFLNGEWAKHVRRWGKKFTSGIRRQESKKITRQEIDATR